MQHASSVGNNNNIVQLRASSQRKGHVINKQLILQQQLQQHQNKSYTATTKGARLICVSIKHETFVCIIIDRKGDETKYFFKVPLLKFLYFFMIRNKTKVLYLIRKFLI